MIRAPKPKNEDQRMLALHFYNILDTEAEPEFDALTELASMICETPISLVSLIDIDRQWFKSARGLANVRETSRDVAFCAHAILGQELFEVSDAAADPRFHDNPLVTGYPGIRFYAGVPLVDKQGFGLGTLCVIDRKPRQLSPTQRQALTHIATAVAGLIQARAGESRFRRIVECAPFGVALIDSRGLIQQPNAALTQLLGHTAEELTGRALTSGIAIGHEESYLEELYARALAVDTVQRTEGVNIAAQTLLVARHKDGHEIPVEVSLTRLGGGLAALTMADTSVRDAINRNTQSARAELQRIIDGMPAMVAYWDRDLHNRFSNMAYQEWFGFTPEQVKGCHISEIIGVDRFKLNEPFIERVLAGAPQLFERSVVNQAGEVRLTLASYVPDWQNGSVQGFYVFVSDITPLKAAEAARQRAEAKLQSVIEAATSFALIVTDLDGTIRLFSRGAELLLGYTADELTDQHTPAIFHIAEEMRARGEELSRSSGKTIEGFEVFVSGVREGRMESGDWTYLRKDGTTIPVHLVITGVREPNGELAGFLGVARDITDQRAYEQGLAAAKESAEATSRAKSDFVANMSHEIRTPLNAVLGLAQLLGDTALTTAQNKYVEMIRASGESLLAILNDVLDFSRIEAGKIELESKRFCLEDTLRMIASIMTVSAGDKELELAIGVGPDVPGFLVGDSLRLQQVLTNLVSNAIKFTDRGEVAIAVTLAEAGTRSIVLRFEVRDTGIGIHPLHQDKLFNAFTQADSSMTRRYGGSGLGLTICRQLVELMGGQIGLESEPGVGSRFWFTVPLVLESGAVTEVRRPAMGHLRVLLADDNRTSLGFLRELMLIWGWQADCVSSGDMALVRYQEGLEQDAPYDLVLLDWAMPGIDGLAALHAIKAGSKVAPPVIVMINARERKPFELSDHVEQANAVLTKPVTSSSLFDAIHDAFASQHPGYQTDTARTQTATAAIRLDGVTVLLVEDNELNQFVASGILQNAGAEVVVAENGQAAVDLLRASLSGFDLVLMDMQMPVMDGFQATRIIRRELGLTLPVLAMSAGVMASERERCIAAGMNDFIAKPIDVAQMLSTIVLNLQPAADSAVSTPAERDEPAVDIEGYFKGLPNNELYRTNLRRLIAELGDTWPGMMVAAREAWTAGNIPEASGLIHKARGAAATLGAKQFAAAALTLEMAMGKSIRQDVEAAFPVAVREMERAVLAIRDWLAKPAAPLQASLQAP